MINTDCFKSYDVRGKVGLDLTPEFAFALGHATAAILKPSSVVTGRDIRLSSEELQNALADGLSSAGVDVYDIGLCGTEEVYFATDHLESDAGIMVTASHNPEEYNGFKIVAEGARPLSNEEFREIEKSVANFAHAAGASWKGEIRKIDTRAAYAKRVLSFINPGQLKPLCIVANAGNGAAGPTFDAIAQLMEASGVALEITRVHHEPDGRFPNGIPNPLLPENHEATASIVQATGADLGVAWDGDFDRCFFFDENGHYVPGEFIVGVLAKAILEREPGAAIVHDPRVVWNTRRIVGSLGGRAVVSRTGHALVKERMREVDAAYGGEMSAHHYFRDFMYCDSGMIPLVLVLDLLSRNGTSLGAEVAEMRERHPSSGEINFRVAGVEGIIAEIERIYRPNASHACNLDGLSMEFGDWRFNLRPSNTEPLLRLNLESMAGSESLEQHLAELTGLILDHGTGRRTWGDVRGNRLEPRRGLI